MKLCIKEWPTARLRDYERNPRKNDDAVDRMVANIREFGFRIPLVAKSDGLVVDGHLRLKAARKIGMATVPVALADDLTDAQIKAFRIAVNKSAEWASWDDALLKIELGELQGLGFDLALSGFGDLELAGIFDEAKPGTGRSGAGSLSAKFMIPPFSVLNAREGWWQDRKRAWLALGIQSEFGRGDAADNPPHEGHGMVDGHEAVRAKQKASRVDTNPGGVGKRKPDAMPGGGGPNSLVRRGYQQTAQRNARRLADAGR